MSNLTQVKDPKNIPAVKHYAILIYVQESRTEYEAPYHERDKGGTYNTVNYVDIQHWVTTDRKLWEEKLCMLEKGESRVGKQKYAAFVVDKLAKVELKVSVNVDIEA